MLATFTSSKETSMASFKLPRPESQIALEDLDLIFYSGSDTEYQQKVADRLSQDYGRNRDDENGRDTGYKTTKTVVFYNTKSRSDHSSYMVFIEALRNCAGDTFDVFESTLRQSTSDRGLVLTVGGDPRSAMGLLEGARHMVLHKTRTKDVRDRQTTLVVKRASLLPRDKWRAQMECALAEGINPRHVTIHSQLSLEEIRSLEPPREFEELHLDAFIIGAMERYPSMNIRRLTDCFVHNFEMFRVTIKRLQVLGLVRGREISLGALDWQLRHERALNAARLLSVTQNNVSAATFLSFIDENTDPRTRAAMIDIVAIILESSGRYDFLKVAHVWPESAGMASILSECRDPSHKTIMDGAIWMNLGVYRLYMCMCRGGENEPLIEAADGLMLISPRRCVVIYEKAQEITRLLQVLVAQRRGTGGATSTVKLPEDQVLSSRDTWCSPGHTT
ncbi:uncharacterized protein ColSpa_12564 [Colletotrichum spaethianum]|uniref:Uncharacterized protein n=1 Tax=Colletotrichum spaethianum TaxID=700344 RepID=A0AA37UTQ0_9PEZI|nr:uncharacterized protein ColSpa_12564 [Colletotrichum spaethianum]GKT52383.1 hypothetical protein ColSpa_12564 [Colletotrichum spaethianum]